MPSRKGSPNKNKAFLNSRLKAMYGDDFDVIMMMAENCKTVHDIALEAKKDMKEQVASSMGDPTEAADSIRYASDTAKTANAELSRLAEYVEPKLKSIEITGDEDNPVVVDQVIQFVGVE